MKTQRGFVELIDKDGNRISVRASKADQLVKKGGYQRVSDPPPKKNPDLKPGGTA